MKPDPRLSVELVRGNGERFRLDPVAEAADRPLDLRFTTSAGEGFGDASFTLSRARNVGYWDLALLSEVRFISESGDVAYEGRAQSVPEGETIQVDASGWMSHARQRQFTDLVVDRDVNQWTDLLTSAKVAYAGIGYGPFVAGSTEGSQISLQPERVAQAGSTGKVVGAQYHAPGPIGRLDVYWSAGLSGTTWRIAAWTTNAQALLDYTGSTTTSTVSAPNGTNQLLLVEPSNSPEWATVWLYNYAAITQDTKFVVTVRPVVWGAHNLTRRDRFDGTNGVFGSDVIGWLVEKYAPKLNTRLVEPTTWPIPHLVWRESITAHEAMKQVNAFHSWKLGVWDDRSLEFAPFDYTQADWQVRDGVNGVRVTSQGDTTENVFNGCAVRYTDFDGVNQRVTPDVESALRDESDWIAANEWDDKAWLEISTSWRMTYYDAVLIGQIALTEANRARRPSTITVPWHIQTVNGQWEPCWKVRANQTISVMNAQSVAPRLITETTWSNNELTVVTDNAVNSLEAVQSRIATALEANGLT